MSQNTKVVYTIQAQPKNDKEADWEDITTNLEDSEVVDILPKHRKQLKDYNVRIVKEIIISEVVTMRDINKLFK